MNNPSRNAQIIERPRLLTKLNQAVKRRLTLISAPSGYGKSVLAAQFANQSTVPVALHPIERRERDLPNLYAQSLRVLHQISSGQSRLTIPSDTLPEQCAALIANHLRSLGTDVIYILDDIQHLEGAAGAEQWLRTLINLMPPNGHLVLIGRTIPEVPLLMEMVAKQDILSIGQNDLRLTSAEIQNLAQDVLGADFEHSELEKLEARLEGWPIGVVLSFYPLEPELERVMLQERSGVEALFEALSESMLQSQPSHIREFLLSSSTLIKMTPELLSNALGIPDGRDYLMEIQSRNLFLTLHSGVYRYHSLFRNFLQKRLKRLNNLKFVDLHYRAARWFEGDNTIDDSLAHYVAAEHHSYALQLAEGVADAYLIQGRVETLLSWESLLSGISQQSGALLYIYSMLHGDRGDIHRSDEYLVQAMQLADTSKNGLFKAKILIQQAVNKMRIGLYQDCIDQLTYLLQWSPDIEAIRGRATMIIGYSYLNMGILDKAIEYLLTALPMYRSVANSFAQSQILQSLSVAYERLGELTQASAYLQDSIAILRELGNPSALASAMNNLGYYYYLNGNFEQAQVTFEEGLSLLANIVDIQTEAALLWNIGDLKRDIGDFSSAQQHYDKALERLPTGDVVMRCYVLLSSALLKRWQQRYSDASSLAIEAEYLALSREMTIHYHVARALIVDSQPIGRDKMLKLAQLDQVIEALKDAKLKQILVLAIAAQSALTDGNRASSRAYLEKAALLSMGTGTAQILIAELVQSPTLLSLWHSIANRYPMIQQQLVLFEAYRLKKKHEITLPIAQPLQTFDLRIFTLGNATVHRDGERILNAKWRSSSARELFFYLLFVGPTLKDQIGTVFWPDSESNQVRSNFHTALKRARNALGSNVIFFTEDDVYALNPAVRIWCDAKELESLVGQARMLAPRDAKTEDLLERARALYKGELLLGFNSDWIISYRAKHRELYLEALIRLAGCFYSRRDYQGAIRLLKKGVELEPYREDMHRFILQCYGDRGQKRKALEHYSELLRLLRADLNIEPEVETQLLFTRLMN